MLVIAADGISPRVIAIDTTLAERSVSPLSDAAEFRSLDMQPDGTLVGFKENSVELWDVPQRRLTKRIAFAADAISPDGQLAAVAEGLGLVIRDTAARRRVFGLGSRLDIKEPIGNLRRVFSLATNPVYPTIASAGPDGCIRLWDLRKSGGPIIWKGHESFVEALAFDCRGRRLASGGTDGLIKLWSATSGEARGAVPFYGGVEALAFSNDARYLVAVGTDNTAQIIDLSNSKNRMFHLDPQGGFTNIVFEPGGDFLLAMRTGLFQFTVPDLEGKLLLKTGNAVALAMAREGQLAVVGSLRKWVEGLMAAQRQEVEGKVGSAVLLFDPRTQSRRTLIGKSRYVRAGASF